MAFTTQKLLDSISRRSFAPSGQTTFQTSEILGIADEELMTTILPEILSVREEFFVHHKDYSITANQAAYDIPARSIGMIVREVHYINSSGNITDLDRIEPEDLDSSTQTAAIPDGFYLKGNQIVLHKIPSSTNGSLRVYFFLRPGDLIETSSAALISGINTGTNTITVSTIPSTWATSDVFDLVKQDGGHEYIDFDKTSSLVSGNDITLSSLPSSLRIGDYVSPQGTSPLIQLPPDFRPILAQAAAAFIMDSMNIPGSEKAYAKLESMLKAGIAMISPRTQGSARVIIPPNWI